MVLGVSTIYNRLLGMIIGFILLSVGSIYAQQGMAVVNPADPFNFNWFEYGFAAVGMIMLFIILWKLLKIINETLVELTKALNDLRLALKNICD